MIQIKININNEVSKNLISSSIYSGIPFFDNGTYITYVFDNKSPHYLGVLSKIPQLLCLDTLVEISNAKEENKYISLSSIDSFLKECSEESKQRKERNKRSYQELTDNLENEKETIKKPKINYSHRSKYLTDRDIFLNIYLSEVDEIIKTRQIFIGDNYNIFESLNKTKKNFNHDFHLFYSSSQQSRDFLAKLDIYETPMDIIEKEIHKRYNGKYLSICNVNYNGYIYAKLERVK